MSQFIDPNIERKSRILRNHLMTNPVIADDIPTFSLVEFNITELCNRTCVFCPRSDSNIYPNRKEYLEVDLYEKIMKGLQRLDFSGKILYSAFSEPLLHKELDQLIMLSKRYCPSSRVEIVTNGDLITVEKLHYLFDVGLDTLLISMYDGPHQRDHFLKMKEEAGLRDEQLILRVRYRSAEEHFGLNLSNRAGMVSIREIGVGPLAEPINRKCFYPFYQLAIDYDATVLLCPHDWGKRLKAGNLKEQSIVEVWTGRAMTFARKRLAQSDRNFSPCDVCDVRGTLIGQEHFEEWQRYYEVHRDNAEG